MGKDIISKLVRNKLKDIIDENFSEKELTAFLMNTNAKFNYSDLEFPGPVYALYTVTEWEDPESVKNVIEFYEQCVEYLLNKIDDVRREARLKFDYGVEPYHDELFIEKMENNLNRMLSWLERDGFYWENNRLVKREKKWQTELFDKLNFHPEVIKSSRKLFADGHYRQAVCEAAIAYENYVKEKAGERSKKVGQNLMFTVFNEKKPIIKLNKLKTITDEDEQAGIKFLSVGLMRAVKNICSHSTKGIENPIEVLRILSIISYLFEKIEESNSIKNEEVQ